MALNKINDTIKKHIYSIRSLFKSAPYRVFHAFQLVFTVSVDKV